MAFPWVPDGVVAASTSVEIKLNVKQRTELLYKEIRETKKWRDGKIERAFSFEIPVKCVISPSGDNYILSWKYGDAKIIRLDDFTGETVSREMISQIQNMASKFGTIKIRADSSGRLTGLANLPELRAAIKAQHHDLSKKRSTKGKDEEVTLLNALSTLMGYPDEAFVQSILNDITPYFQFYGKLFDKRSPVIEEINDPHPAYNNYKIRLANNIEIKGPENNLHISRRQTNILDEQGHERKLEKYEPVTKWHTTIVMKSSTNIIKSYEDIKNFTTQDKRLKGISRRKIILTTLLPAI